MKRQICRVFLLLALAVSAQSVASEGQTLYKEFTTPNGEGILYAVHLPDGFDPENGETMDAPAALTEGESVSRSMSSGRKRARSSTG